MKPSRSAKEFKKFAESSGKRISEVSASDAVELMLEFYRKIRATNCPIDDNGDMLLYQWGVYDWGKGETFNIDITRQFIIKGSSGDEGMSQLSFTLHFTPSEKLHKIRDGNRWCESLSELEDFREFILNSEAYQAIRDLRPARVELDWSGI